MNLNDQCREAISQIYDPEIPVNIYDLGLIYGVQMIDEVLIITMTLTTPMCPVADSLPLEVEAVCRAIVGVTDVRVDLVFDPIWNMDMVTEAGKLELGLF
jgi:FeS assembly SUF system protein